MAPAEALPDTPVMRQYQELKKRHPDALLFFRLGDFYELFAQDAERAAPAVGLVLTARQGVPMCGVPYHQAQTYVAKLLRAGFKIALAEQMEEPSAAKKLVRREVTRLITPGTVIEDSLLEPTSANFLFAIEHDIVGWGAAALDVSTGEFWATQALNDRGSRKLFDLLARVRPSEIVASAATSQALSLSTLNDVCLTIGEESSSTTPAWAKEPAWLNKPLAARAALRCRAYVERSQFHLKELLTPSYREAGGEMQLDDTAIRTLELVDSPHSLWKTLNRCRTAMGSRKLRHWILHPSTELPEIELRQNCVEDFVTRPDERETLSRLISEMADLPRVASRLGTRSAGPRDLGGLRRTLDALPALVERLSAISFCPGLTTLAAELADSRSALSGLTALLHRSVEPEPPARVSDGRFIRPGFNAELDELRALKTDSQGFLERLEEKERAATGIASMKAGYNSVFGYYFEVTKTHSAKVPDRFTRKQTLTNAERYITPELKELENKILGAEEKVQRLEAQLFEQLRQNSLDHHAALLKLGHQLAELDVFIALAESASLHDLVRPKVDLSHELDIVEGRHPTLAAMLPAGTFVPNPLKLDAQGRRIALLTGPNMSGKSTYLRQNALICVMAQMGSFVPAKSARIGIVDKVLTRIGAQDALAKGDSTFMVEMKETSHILRSATVRSLVILDEVGRGTSTFDGISIAWAALEHLHNSYGEKAGPRVLFATHYFELTKLPELLPGVANYNVEAREWTNAEGKTELVFLHKVSEGPADRSYGIQVAALAGLPASLLTRAREILSTLESQAPAEASQMPLFDENPVLQALRLLDPEHMTPMEALSALNALKKKL
jgi:DNA mismatch repair protein MutS